MGLDALLAAQRSDHAGSHGEHSAVDAWIVRFLLTRGTRLLTSEAARLAHLARIRDRSRRHEDAERGHRAATIAMPSAAWDALERIRKDRGLPSLGKTLAALISETAASKTAASKTKGRGRGKEATTPDLLDQLGPLPNERRTAQDA
jgi:macrodomain Ter protein organizer (MatP/YcbG family)